MTSSAQQGSAKFGKHTKNAAARSQTLARLLDAAVDLFAERGVEMTTVVDITKAAKLANGTFYNYFPSKSELVAEVYELVTDALVADIVSELDKLNDGPTRIALGTLWFVDAVSSEPHWGWTTVHALEQPTPFRGRSAAIIAGHIEVGVRQGFFNPRHSQVIVELFQSVLVGAIRMRLERFGPETDEIGLAAAEMLLRMLGMSSGRAETIAKRTKAKYGPPPAPRSPVTTPPSPRHGRVPSGVSNGAPKRPTPSRPPSASRRS